MATIDLGRLGFVNKGTYNNSTTYEKNDLVQFTDGGILSTYLYIDSTAQSGQAPSSSGTAGSRWVYYAKGVADSLASAGNNKVIVTNASGQVTPLAIGSASQVLKVNSGANGFEFATDAGGGVKQVKQAVKTDVQSWQNGSNVMIGAVGTITPTSASNKILIQTSGSLGASTSTTQSIAMRFAVGGSVSNSSTLVDALGNADGSRSRAMFSGSCSAAGASWFGTNFGYTYLHAPNTTSAIQYQLCAMGYDGSVTHYINRSGRDSNDITHWRSHHTITLTEIDSSVL